MFFVYILANLRSKVPVLYVGIANDLRRRVAEHRQRMHGFTARYNVTTLVHYETFGDPVHAIAREKRIKGWSREKKVALVESRNPGWLELLSAGGRPAPS